MKKSIEIVMLSLAILFVVIVLIQPIIKGQNPFIAFSVGGCIGYISQHIATFLINNK